MSDRFDVQYCGKDGKTYSTKEVCPMECSKGFDISFWKCKGKCPCPKLDWINDKFLKPHIIEEISPEEEECLYKCYVKIKNW